jgi:hypothetical protein
MRNIALIGVFQAIVHEEGGAMALPENTNKVWRYVRSTKSRICRIIRGKSGGCCPASSPQSLFLAGRVGSQILVRASYWETLASLPRLTKLSLSAGLQNGPKIIRDCPRLITSLLQLVLGFYGLASGSFSTGGYGNPQPEPAKQTTSIL